MFDFDEKIHFPHNFGSGCFPPEKPRYTMSEEMLHTEKEMKETIAHLLKFQERLQTKFDDMLKHITSDNVIFKNTFAESHRLFLESVKNEINVFEGNVDSSFTLFKNTLESDYAHLSEDVKGQITASYNEFVEKLNEYKAELNFLFDNFRENMNGYKEELNGTYDDFRKAMESRIDRYNSASVEAHNDFVASINARLSEMERAFNADYASFVNQVNNSIQEFKTDWANTIEARLDGQDSTVAEAVAYMKNNLSASVEAMLAEMKNDGSLDSLIVTETKDIIGNKYFDITRLSGMCRNVVVDGETYSSWSEAIANAIAQCDETGMEIYFPAGTYYIDEPIVPLNGTVIKGATPSTTVIKVIPKTNINGITLMNCVGSGFTLRDICLSGDYDHEAKSLESASGVGVYIHAGGECDNITFENVVIENFAEHGFHICDQSWVIMLSKCVIRRNKQYGLYLDKCSDNMFSNLAIYQNGYGGIYTNLGGNNKYCNLKVYLNSRDCENSGVDSKYLAGISTNMTSLESFVNVEIQENFRHGFMIGGSSDYALHNILFDANGFENNESANSRDLYIWGSRNIHGDIMLSAMKEGRGILDHRIYTSVNTKNINLTYYKNSEGDVDGSITESDCHITEDDTTENVRIVDGYTI